MTDASEGDNKCVFAKKEKGTHDIVGQRDMENGQELVEFKQNIFEMLGTEKVGKWCGC